MSGSKHVSSQEIRALFAMDTPPAHQEATPAGPARDQGGFVDELSFGGYSGGATDMAVLLSPPQGPDEIGRLAHYRARRILGRGGMGLVFEAEDTQLQRWVALKVIKPEIARDGVEQQRFLREARATANLQSDHIITIYQVGQYQDVPYLAMELLRGETLEQWLQRGRQPTLDLIVQIGRETALGLATAHQQGLIHRDIKPANLWLEARNQETGIRSQGSGVRSQESRDKQWGSLSTLLTPASCLVTPDFRVKILDFGLVRAVTDEVQLTQKGMAMGTPSYMAPEQAQGEALDARTDLFSLGCVLYRLCTGQLPFKADSSMEQLLALVNDDPVPVRTLNPQVPRPLADLVMRLLAKKPVERPASAEFVADAFREMAAHAVTARNPAQALASTPHFPLAMPVTVAVALPFRPATSWRRRWLPITLALMALCVCGLGALAIYCAVQMARPAAPLQTRAPESRSAPTTPKATAALKAIPKEESAWQRHVAELKPDQQVQAVIARLQELNRGYTGKHSARIVDGTVMELALNTDQITNIAPLSVLKGLQTLDCCGSVDRPRGRGQLSDLTPLAELRLDTLKIAFTQVKDLRPLQNMKSLTRLFMQQAPVTDLRPLQGLRLEHVDCEDTLVRDLAPLAGMPMKVLHFSRTPITELAPLSQMPQLDNVHFAANDIRDLTPLAYKSIRQLRCDGTKITDFTVLKTLPLLLYLSADVDPVRHAALLKSIPTLVTINGKTAAEFFNLTPSGAKKVTSP